jgi:hypothetical protein
MEDAENMLKDSYDVDEQSYADSDSEIVVNSYQSIDLPSVADWERTKNILDFIQAIKDENSQYVKDFITVEENKTSKLMI